MYDKLIGELYLVAGGTTSSSRKELLEKAAEAIKTLSSADVRPVKKGHYIGEYDGYADGSPVYDMWYCSECGCHFEDWDEEPTYNFCPNCGADMREGKP